MIDVSKIGESPRMDADTFVREVMRTASGDMPAIRDRFEQCKALLREDMRHAIQQLEFLDELKKFLFYGKNPKGGVDSKVPIKSIVPDDYLLNVLHAALGMATESGEMLLQIYGHLFEGKSLDGININEESGDSFWYQGLLADTTQTSFGETFERVIAKLRKRYPEKFTEYDAINRDLDAERAVLEGK